MGFFGDILKMAASEVANTVIDGVNEAIMAQEEQDRYREEFIEQLRKEDYDTLLEYIQDPEDIDNDLIEAIKNILIERDKLVKKLHNISHEEAFSEFDDQALVYYYEKLLVNQGALYKEDDAEYVVCVFQKELMSRPTAKRIYAQSKEDYFENFSYDSIKAVVASNDIFDDEILKAEATKELEYRNDLINSIVSDEMDDLDNTDFMAIYDKVRKDKTIINYGNTQQYMQHETDSLEYTLYNNDFGEFRNIMLKICEHEISKKRKYLLEDFLNKYCEEEIELYYNYPDKKLKFILSFTELIVDNKTWMLEHPEQYDLCDKIIADLILTKREEQ